MALSDYLQAVFGDRRAPDGSLVRDNFARWFAASKVTDKRGIPILVYHGTNADFSMFDPSRSGSKSKTGAPEGTFFFTDRADVASSYTVAWQGDFSAQFHDGANVVPAYLRLRKPLRLSAKGESWRDIYYKGEFRDINEIAAMAKASGRYDGVIITRVRDKGIGHVDNPISTTYIAFSANQVKSAIGNSGSFHESDADMTDRQAILMSNALRAKSLVEATRPRLGRRVAMPA